MMYWWVWVKGRVYKLLSDGETIRYEGNGSFIVKDAKQIALEQSKKQR